MDIETISTDGITMRYFRFGDPHGQPFIIIPGVSVKSVMLSHEMISHQYAAIAECCDVYVIDRREDMPDKYSVYDMAEDTAKILGTMGLKDAVVYGVSQGGMIAQLLAIKHPELVKKLILCSTAPYAAESSVDIIGKWIEYAENKDTEGLMLSFGENIYTKDYFEKYREAFQTFAHLITDEDLRRFLITLKAIDGFDVRNELRSIKCPVLIIAADNDRIFAPGIAEEAAALTNAELHIYKGMAHSVYDEEPDVLTKIRGFVS